MTPQIKDKLAKVLALTTSPNEGEAAAAMLHLQRLLKQHNLTVADLEAKGQAKPEIQKRGYDLAKAAFKWKLNLAECIAEFHYCYAIVNHNAKTVNFIGRPDNVEALEMLYGWLIEQIRQLSTRTRKEHIQTTNEHIDPLRWQLQFGLGVVSRLDDRLAEIKARREKEMADEAGTALVVHHGAEISDWLEEKYGYRVDGKKTKKERDREEMQRVRDEYLDKLKVEDIEAYYKECPWERPLTPEQAKRQEEEQAKWEKEENARRRKNQARRERRLALGGGYRPEKEIDWDAEDQKDVARRAGAASAKEINLEPFLEGGAQRGGELRG